MEGEKEAQKGMDGWTARGRRKYGDVDGWIEEAMDR